MISINITDLLKKGFKQTLLISIVIALFAVISGLTASYYLDLAAGGAIVLILVLLFFAKAFLLKLRI